MNICVMAFLFGGGMVEYCHVLLLLRKGSRNK